MPFKRLLKKAVGITSDVLSAPSRAKIKVKGKIARQRIVEKRAEKNVRKRFGGGGIGRRELATLKAKEVRRLQKMLKAKFSSKQKDIGNRMGVDITKKNDI